MSNAVSALGGVSFDGFATVREIGPLGMISLRAKPDVKGLAAALKVAAGLPEQRRIVTDGDKATAWMSPDEFLLIVPYAEVSGVMESLAKNLDGQHHLAANVSDARAVFRVEGAKADQVIAKLCPADLTTLAPNEVRRTRAAQVAVAFWKDDKGYTLVCFRSVAAYVMGLLEHSAQPGSELF
jgi:sarcosine oxidase subunit gamma